MNSEFISYRKFMDDTMDSHGKILQVNSHYKVAGSSYVPFQGNP
jgi:hypothetical protein